MKLPLISPMPSPLYKVGGIGGLVFFFGFNSYNLTMFYLHKSEFFSKIPDLNSVVNVP